MLFCLHLWPIYTDFDMIQNNKTHFCLILVTLKDSQTFMDRYAALNVTTHFNKISLIPPLDDQICCHVSEISLSHVFPPCEHGKTPAVSVSWPVSSHPP